MRIPDYFDFRICSWSSNWVKRLGSSREQYRWRIFGRGSWRTEDITNQHTSYSRPSTSTRCSCGQTIEMKADSLGPTRGKPWRKSEVWVGLKQLLKHHSCFYKQKYSTWASIPSKLAHESWFCKYLRNASACLRQYTAPRLQSSCCHSTDI